MSFKLSFNHAILLRFFSCYSEWHYDIVGSFARRINQSVHMAHAVVLLVQSSRFSKSLEKLYPARPFLAFEVEFFRWWNLLTRHGYLLNHALLYRGGDLWLWTVSELCCALQLLVVVQLKFWFGLPYVRYFWFFLSLKAIGTCHHVELFWFKVVFSEHVATSRQHL